MKMYATVSVSLNPFPDLMSRVQVRGGKCCKRDKVHRTSCLFKPQQTPQSSMIGHLLLNTTESSPSCGFVLYLLSTVAASIQMVGDVILTLALIYVFRKSRTGIGRCVLCSPLFSAPCAESRATPKIYMSLTSKIVLQNGLDAGGNDRVRDRHGGRQRVLLFPSLRCAFVLIDSPFRFSCGAAVSATS